MTFRLWAFSFFGIFWLAACSTPRLNTATEPPKPVPTVPEAPVLKPTGGTTAESDQRSTVERIPSPQGARPNGGSVSLGVSYIGGIEVDRAWYHVNLRDEFEGFEPTVIEIVDAVTGRVLAGPFDLTKKESELCRSELYETEGIDVSELPPEWWYEQTIEPYYIYRISLRSQDGSDQTVEVYDVPGVCASEAA